MKKRKILNFCQIWKLFGRKLTEDGDTGLGVYALSFIFINYEYLMDIHVNNKIIPIII